MEEERNRIWTTSIFDDAFRTFDLGDSTKTERVRLVDSTKMEGVLRLGDSTEMERVRLVDSFEMEGLRQGDSTKLEGVRLVDSTELERVRLGDSTKLDGLRLGDSSEIEVVRNRVPMLSLDGVRVAQAKEMKEDEGVHARLTCLEHTHQKALKSCADMESRISYMESRISRIENECSTSRQSMKIIEAALRNGGMECHHDKWYELHQKIQSSEDARRKDKSQHEMLQTKYESIFGAIDRSIIEINSRLNEKVCRSVLNEAIGRMEVTSVVSDLTGEMTDLKSRLDEKASKIEVHSITCKLEDMASEPLSQAQGKLDSELRGKIIELLKEKASSKDLESMHALLNQSCRDLTKSILAVRREVVRLESHLNERERKSPRKVSPERCGDRHAKTVEDASPSRERRERKGKSLERVGGGFGSREHPEFGGTQTLIGSPMAKGSPTGKMLQGSPTSTRSSKSKAGLDRVASSPCLSSCELDIGYHIKA